MIRRFCILLFVSVILAIRALPVNAAETGHSEFDMKLSQEEVNARCKALRANQKQSASEIISNVSGPPITSVINSAILKAQNASNDDIYSHPERWGNDIIPEEVLIKIYNTTAKISATVANTMAIGQALTCFATTTNEQNADVGGIHLFYYPDVMTWISGTIIYFLGFMMTVSVTFYLVDIGFKLGFAIIMLPIAIALWPFPWTKDKLSKLISIMLKSAAIFAFLALTVTYAYLLLTEAIDDTFAFTVAIDFGMVEWVSDNFSADSSTFMVCLFATVYGMKLIGATIPDYVDKIFPDNIFGSASPIHGSMTQAVDFAKQKAAPLASYAGDVVKTQTGNVLKGGGKLLKGDYNKQIKSAASYIVHPNRLADKAISKGGNLVASGVGVIGKTTTGALTGTVGRILLGKKASKDLQNRINEGIEKGKSAVRQGFDIAGSAVNKGMAAGGDKLAHNKLTRGLAAQGNKLANTKLGQAASKAADKTQKAAGAVSSKYHKTVGNLSAKIEARRQKRDAKIKAAEEKKQRRLQRIGNAQNAVRSFLSAPRRKAYAKIDEWLGDKEGNGALKKAAKKTARGILKAPVGLVTGAVEKPLTFASDVAFGIAKIPARAASGLSKNRAKASSGVSTVRRRITKTLVKTLNVYNWTKVTGNVMMSVGDKMTRNAKTEEELREERIRKEVETESYERRERAENRD